MTHTNVASQQWVMQFGAASRERRAAPLGEGLLFSPVSSTFRDLIKELGDDMDQSHLDELLSPDYMIELICGVHQFIDRHIAEFPEIAFAPCMIERPLGWKPLVAVDLLAERVFMNLVSRKFGRDAVRIYGEESLGKDPDLSKETKPCILVDMIDGTDLLERDFSNWCSAIIVFNPLKRTIEGSFVSLRSERGKFLYFARRGAKAFKKRLHVKSKNEEMMELSGPNKERLLQDASMCMYAQKSGNLLEILALSEKPHLVRWLRDTAEQDQARFRFYNFAGNPMMVRLAEGVTDLVLDLKGQYPHDVVPGAFIALQSGASISKSNGEPFSIDELAETLLRPASSRLDYILAANENLLSEVKEIFV